MLAKIAAKTIVVVEDRDTLRRYLSGMLKESGFNVLNYSDAESAMARLRRGGINLVLTDLRLPGRSGLDVLAMVKTHKPDLPVIIMTAFGSVSSAVEAMKLGADDYIEKPFEGAQLLSVLKRLLPKKKGRGKKVLAAEAIIGESPALKKIIQAAKRAARTEASILLLGESGTGKELFAQYVHENSSRYKGAFVAVSCAAIPGPLLENELFGHEPGAYTGATHAQAGRFERAAGGTLFLDEIGDMPLELQPKILRAIQEKEIERVGSHKTQSVDVRLVTATHRDLKSMVEQGTFREDLYYRINVVPLVLPPLRKRAKDIPLLAKVFAQRAALAADVEPPKIEGPALDALVSYPWPGNIRELQNVMERAVILSADGRIQADQLNLPTIPEKPMSSTVNDLKKAGARAVRDRELFMIQDALAKEKGNRSAAARRLGITYRTLLNKIKKYQIKK